MRGKIRIKVKYIVFIPIIILILVPNILFITGRCISRSDIYFESLNIALKDFSYGILNLYTKYPKIISPFEGEAYYEMAKLKYDISEKRIVSNFENGIRFGFIKIDTLDNLNESIELTKKGLKDKNSDHFGKNAINLMNLYIEKGDLESASKVSEALIKEEEFKVKLAGEVGKLYLFHITNNKEDAKKYGEELSRKYNNEVFNNFNYDFLDGQYRNVVYNYENGGSPKIDRDKKYIIKTLNEVNLVSKEIYINDEDIERNTFDIKSKEDYYNGKNKLKGRVTYNGEPLKYRPVILGDLEDLTVRDGSTNNSMAVGLYMRGTMNSRSDFVTYTDENGYYEFDNIPNLKDALGIFTVVPNFISNEVNPFSIESRIITLEKDKENIFNIHLGDSIKFKNPGVHQLTGDEFIIEFDKVKDAESYIVYLSYSGMYGNDNEDLRIVGMSNYYEVKENKLKINLKDGSLISQFYRNPTPEDNEKYTYLDNVGLIKAGEVTVSIDAFNKEGNRINSTNSFVYGNKEVGLILKGKEKELNKGEELFLDRKFKEGIDWFSDKIKEEGIKREYIYPLIYLSINEDFISKEEGERLIKELYKINKDKGEFDYFNELLKEKA